MRRCHRADKSHHQVATIVIERSAGDVTGGLGSGKANQIGDFKSGAEALHRIICGEAFEQVVWRMFASQFGIIMPGQIAFTVMPNLPSCFAAARVSPSSPAFEAV